MLETSYITATHFLVVLKIALLYYLSVGYVNILTHSSAQLYRLSKGLHWLDPRVPNNRSSGLHLRDSPPAWRKHYRDCHQSLKPDSGGRLHGCQWVDETNATHHRGGTTRTVQILCTKDIKLPSQTQILFSEKDSELTHQNQIFQRESIDLIKKRCCLGEFHSELTEA